MQGSGGIAALYLTSAVDGGEWSASRPGRFTPGEIAAGPIRFEAEWAPESVWTQWRKEECLDSAGNRTPAVQPVARVYTDRKIPT
jgi:hypothetical protein